jgi:hypothetical protein
MGLQEILMWFLFRVDIWWGFMFSHVSTFPRSWGYDLPPRIIMFSLFCFSGKTFCLDFIAWFESQQFCLACQIICKYHTWCLYVYPLEHLFRMSYQDFVSINSLTLLLPSLPIFIITVSLEVLIWKFFSNSKFGVWCAPLLNNTFY